MIRNSLENLLHDCTTEHAIIRADAMVDDLDFNSPVDPFCKLTEIRPVLSLMKLALNHSKQSDNNNYISEINGNKYIFSVFGSSDIGLLMDFANEHSLDDLVELLNVYFNNYKYSSIVTVHFPQHKSIQENLIRQNIICNIGYIMTHSRSLLKRDHENMFYRIFDSLHNLSRHDESSIQILIDMLEADSHFFKRSHDGLYQNYDKLTSNLKSLASLY